MKKKKRCTVCRNMLRRIALLVLLGSAIQTSVAQNKLNFVYDNDGNRTQRVIPSTRSAAAEPENSFQEEMTGQTIKIHPNPTRGELTVTVSNLRFTSASLVIYDVSGIAIVRSEVTATNTVLDITPCPAGIYILQIEIDNKTSTRKIVKE